MGLKPDILEKSENLLDKVDREIVPKINKTFPFIVGLLCVSAVAMIGTVLGVVVLLIR